MWIARQKYIPGTFPGYKKPDDDDVSKKCQTRESSPSINIIQFIQLIQLATMFGDSLLIVFISVCTALLGEGQWHAARPLEIVANLCFSFQDLRGCSSIGLKSTKSWKERWRSRARNVSRWVWPPDAVLTKCAFSREAEGDARRGVGEESEEETGTGRGEAEEW